MKFERYLPALVAVAVVMAVSASLRGQDKPRRGGGIFDFAADLPPVTTRAVTTKAAATKPVGAAPAAGERRLAPVVASAIQIVADDFVTDIHHNGKPIP